MRPWRDIISAEIWDQLFKLYKNREKKTLSQLTRLEDLHILRNQIIAYHSFKKDDFNTLPARIDKLKYIHRKAMEYLKKNKIDLKRAAQRKFGEKHRNMMKGVYTSEDPYVETIERNVLTLARRALRKAKYLESLRKLYSDNGLKTPQEFIDQLNDYESENDPKYLSLGKAVNLEKIDPGHRPVPLEGVWRPGTKLESYFQFWEKIYQSAYNSGYQMHTLLAHWFLLKDPNKAPFFLWLENHPVSLGPKDYNSLTQVNYLGLKGEKSLPSSKSLEMMNLRMVILKEKELQMIDIGKPNAKPELCDTFQRKDYVAQGTTIKNEGEYMGKELSGGEGLAAYVWTGQEMFIAQHRGGQLHHSSFVSGQKVRCAGMIKIREGKVVYLDTHSGHYLPKPEHGLNLAKKLGKLGVIDSDAKVNVRGWGKGNLGFFAMQPKIKKTNSPQ